MAVPLSDTALLRWPNIINIAYIAYWSFPSISFNLPLYRALSIGFRHSRYNGSVCLHSVTLFFAIPHCFGNTSNMAAHPGTERNYDVTARGLLDGGWGGAMGFLGGFFH